MAKLKWTESYSDGEQTRTWTSNPAGYTLIRYEYNTGRRKKQVNIIYPDGSNMSYGCYSCLTDAKQAAQDHSNSHQVTVETK